MVYDAADGYTVLFDSYFVLTQRGYIDINTTWAYQNDSWRNITTTSAPSPPGPYLYMAYDAKDSYVVAWDPSDPSCVHAIPQPCNGTWTFQRGNWTHISTASGPPSASRSTDELAFDAADGYTLLYTAVDVYDNETWTFSGGNWTEVDPGGTLNGTYEQPGIQWGGPGNNGALSYDSLDGYVVLFGGVIGCAPASGGSCYFDGPAYNTTWEYLAGNWTLLRTASAPPGRTGGQMVQDPRSGNLLLFGGYSIPPVSPSDPVPSSFELNDTWEFAAGSWTNLTSSKSPPGTDFSPIAADPAINGILLRDPLRSDSTTGAFNGYSPGDYTWVWSSNPSIQSVTISASPLPTAPAIPVTFVATVAGGVAPLTYNWSFGDGGSSSLPAPSHAFAAAGTYEVALTVSDPFGARGYAAESMDVSPSLAVAASAFPNPTDRGVQVHFSESAGGGTGHDRFSWNLGDGNLSLSPEVNHSYASPGNYPVALSATDSAGENATASLAERVNPTLSLPVIRASTNTPALGQLVNFSAHESGGTIPYSYAWFFGDGGTGGSLENISHVFTTNGPFISTVVVTDAVGATVAAVTNLSIALNVSAFGNSSFGAAPLVVGFESRLLGGAPGFSYSWLFGDGAASALADPAHTYETAGSYRASLLVRDQGGQSATSGWNLTVVPGGGPVSVGLTASSDEIPLGGSVSVLAVAAGGSGAYSFTWTGVPSGCIEIAPIDLACSPSQSGSYVLLLSVTDPHGDRGNGSVGFEVGAISATGPGGSASASPGIPATLAWESGTLVAVVAAIAGLVVGLRVRSTRPMLRDVPPDRYASFHKPTAASGVEEVTPPADPIDELF